MWPVWQDWVIYWTLGNFSKPLATISLPKSPTFLDNFAMMSKSLIFLVKSFLVNFYRHLATFYWSHCLSLSFHLSVTYTYYLSLSLSLCKNWRLLQNLFLSLLPKNWFWDMNLHGAVFALFSTSVALIRFFTDFSLFNSSFQTALTIVHKSIHLRIEVIEIDLLATIVL